MNTNKLTVDGWVEGFPIRVVAVWHGGEYAELTFADFPEHPFDVLNLWGDSSPRVPFEAERLSEALTEWTDSMTADELWDYRVEVRSR